MPTNDYTSDTSWTAPFATKDVTITAIGAGGGGGGDSGSGSDAGSGGGGGGFARASYSIGEGEVLTINIGAGGQGETNGTAEGGQNTTVRNSAGSIFVRGEGGGGRKQSDPASGGGTVVTGGTNVTRNNGQDTVRVYSDSAARGGYGGGAGNQNNDSGHGNTVSCDFAGGAGGDGTNLDGSDANNGPNAVCDDGNGKNGGGFGGGGGGGARGNRGGRGANGAARISWTYHAPTITSFTASTQTSGTTGVPSDDIVLTWATTYADNLSINQGVGSVTNLNTTTVNSGLQSVAGSNSPASKTYTLTASGPGGTVTATATGYVYNDNTPNSCSAPSTTTDGVSLNNLEPNTTYSVFISAIQGIDMITAVTAVSSGLQVSPNNSNFSQVIYITNGSPFYLRFTSDPLNTDPSGQKTAARTLSYTVGTCSSSISIQTRAPDVSENFDFGDLNNAYPYPDIDQVSNTPSQYLTSPTTLTIGDEPSVDAEISVEIKVNNPDAEIRIKHPGSSTFGSWQSARSI